MNEKELRRLVSIAQQQRMRFLTFDPRFDEMGTAYQEVILAYLRATTDLLHYLEDCLDMRSDFRKD